jgi:hypothetical protein
MGLGTATRRHPGRRNAAPPRAFADVLERTISPAWSLGFCRSARPRRLRRSRRPRGRASSPGTRGSTRLRCHHMARLILCAGPPWSRWSTLPTGWQFATRDSARGPPISLGGSRTCARSRGDTASRSSNWPGSIPAASTSPLFFVSWPTRWSPLPRNCHANRAAAPRRARLPGSDASSATSSRSSRGPSAPAPL